MANYALHGKGGSVYIPGTPNVPIASVTDWTCEIDAENVESSALGNQWREFVVGMRGFQGKIAGYYDVVQDTTGQASLYNSFLAGSSVILQMSTGTAAGAGWFEGNANITRIAVNTSHKAIVSIEFTYVGTGVLNHMP